MTVHQLPNSLASWLSYLETLHPKTIAMGLDRVGEVYRRMKLILSMPVITVTGTNGKGSTCAMLDCILRSAAYRVGLYMSPHLLRYNERVKINGVEAADQELCDAFTIIETLRDDVPLTYFEFGTLAALLLFARANLDVLILEVGLGGRLDAVNIIDADVAVLTSVDLDHMDYLGPTRESIGYEKAGIFRAGRAAICAEPNPPESVLRQAKLIGAQFYQLGEHLGYINEGKQWQYWGRISGEEKKRAGLAFPALRGSYQLANASAAIAALDALGLPISMGALREGLLKVQLPGRFQVLPGRPTVVLDVAHNPHAARVLATNLFEQGYFLRTFAVFGMYQDKDHAGVIAALQNRIDLWLVVSLPGARGASATQLQQSLIAAAVAEQAIKVFPDPQSAYRYACEQAGEADRIAVFGSFLTVAAIMALSSL